MVRGTRLLMGPEARELMDVVAQLRLVVEKRGFEPILVSALAEHELFAGQLGDNRMFELDATLSGRREVLLPEVTAVLRREYRDSWSKDRPKPVRLWYAQRCYRYDRPQRGRWREFWQFGVEHLGAEWPEALEVLMQCLEAAGLRAFEVRKDVERGMAYYNAKGFEVWKNGLQVAGGGSYPEGVGWAIGVDRLILTRREDASAPNSAAI